MRARSDVVLAFGTVKGPVRPDNQDDFLVWEPADDEAFARHGRLLGVADGMGGGPGGAEASRTALRALLAAYLDSPDGLTTEARLAAAYRGACAAVAAEGERNRALLGMGTTVTAVVQRGSSLVGVHVGDSRCILVRDGDVQWLTSLHLSTLHDHRLTRAVGVGGQGEEPEPFAVSLQPGDRILLVTDGLWRAITPEACLAALHGRSATDAVARMLTWAQQDGGDDNATLVLLQWSGEGASEEAVDVEPVSAEASRPIDVRGVPRRRLASYWPWVLLLLGGVLGVAAGLARR